MFDSFYLFLIKFFQDMHIFIVFMIILIDVESELSDVFL